MATCDEVRDWVFAMAMLGAKYIGTFPHSIVFLECAKRIDVSKYKHAGGDFLKLAPALQRPSSKDIDGILGCLNLK